MMKVTTLGHVFQNLDELDWRNSVYINVQDGLSSSSPCFVVDADNAELGADGFTPLATEKAEMQEFLSVQDLRSIAENLKFWRANPTLDDLCRAAEHYFENDAFLPSGSLD